LFLLPLLKQSRAPKACHIQEDNEASYEDKRQAIVTLFFFFFHFFFSVTSYFSATSHMR